MRPAGGLLLLQPHRKQVHSSIQTLSRQKISWKNTLHFCTKSINNLCQILPQIQKVEVRFCKINRLLGQAKRDKWLPKWIVPRITWWKPQQKVVKRNPRILAATIVLAIYVAPVFGRHHKAFVFQDFLYEFSPQYIKHINYDRQPSRTRTSAYGSKYNVCNLQAHVDYCHSIRKRRMVMVINTEFAYQLS